MKTILFIFLFAVLFLAVLFFMAAFGLQRAWGGDHHAFNIETDTTYSAPTGKRPPDFEPKPTFYPNPTNGELTCITSVSCEVRFYSIAGALVLNKQFSPGVTAFDLDGPNGTYFYLVEPHGFAGKIVKVR